MSLPNWIRDSYLLFNWEKERIWYFLNLYNLNSRNVAFISVVDVYVILYEKKSNLV